MGNRTPLFSGVLHLGKATFINFAKKFFYEPDGLFYPVFLFPSRCHSGESPLTPSSRRAGI
ncbi:MAG TPA: hypothetical protein VLH59_16820 [Ignavibacteriaceae bacterium]|nr:hypothetical protein [Ignavibacteriaceae bacterium]